MNRILGFAVALVLGAFALKAGAATVQMYKSALAATSIAATAINSIAWTGWIPVPDSRSVALEIGYTYSAGTAVTMRCETSDVSTTANDSGYDLHILSDSATAGPSTSVTHTWSNAISAASEKWTWTVRNLPEEWINCGFTATTGDASDVATVKYKAVTP